MNAPPPGFDRARWKAPETLEWALTHTADFLPVARIAAADAPSPLPDGDPWTPPGWDALLTTTHASAALLLVSGQVVARYEAEPGGLERPRMLFSITKSVVGLTALALAERGVLDLAARVDAIVPELAGTAFALATVSDLLAMTDGVPFGEEYADPLADIHRYSRAYWGDAPGGTRRALLDLPGRAGGAGGFAYRTPVADVLGWVLHAASGRTLSRLVEDVVWRPIGAARPAHLVLDTGGHEIAGAGLNAAAVDLARLARAMTGHGPAFLSAATLDRLFAGGDRAAFARAGYDHRDGWSYGGLWWHAGGETIAALGVHGQRLYVDRAGGWAFVRLGAAPGPDNRPYDGAHAAFTTGLRAALARR